MSHHHFQAVKVMQVNCASVEGQSWITVAPNVQGGRSTKAGNNSGEQCKRDIQTAVATFETSEV